MSIERGKEELEWSVAKYTLGIGYDGRLQIGVNIDAVKNTVMEFTKKELEIFINQLYFFSEYMKEEE